MRVRSPSEVDRDALRDTLERVFSRHWRRPRRVLSLRRRRSAYASSCPLTNIKVTLDGGQKLELVAKDLSPAAQLPTAKAIRPRFLYDPRREIEAYQVALKRTPWAAPMFYGIEADAHVQRYWLFVERVAGRVLWQVGDFGVWLNAARWLARFHAEQASAVASSPKRRRDTHLLVYDRAFFRQWSVRAEQAVRRRTDLSAGMRRQFRRLIDGYERVVARLAALPRMLIHGEFYASNVIVRRGRGGPAISALDWELCGIGPAAIDLAALVSGKWPEERREQMIRAYQKAFDERGSGKPLGTGLDEAVGLARLHLAMQMLGWAAEWSPPKAHSQDWLREALRSADELGL